MSLMRTLPADAQATSAGNIEKMILVRQLILTRKPMSLLYFPKRSMR
jgi:hypothetical protein